MRTIVFLEMSYSGSSRDALFAAEKLGFFTVVLTENEHLLQRSSKFAGVHQVILVDFDDRDSIRHALRRIEKQGKTIETIISFWDRYVLLAAEMAEERGINRFSTTAIKKMEDKALTRKALNGTSFCPYFDIYEPGDSLSRFLRNQEEELPLIVKSPKSCGSNDVMLVKTPERLKYCVKKLMRQYPSDPVLVEEYLDGPQILVEVLVHQKNVHIVAAMEQEIQNGPRFIVTGYALPDTVPSEIQESLEKAVTKIMQLLGMKNGACHLELRYVRNKWRVIEINPRISGGAMNSMIQTAYGINLVKETIKLAVGETPDLSKQHERNIFTQYLTVPTYGYVQKITGTQRARRSPGVLEVYVKPRKNHYLSPPLSMAYRYAYVIATGDTLEAARDRAKSAAAKIQFHLSSSKASRQQKR